MDVRVEHIKKAEHRRIDAFELWSWRRLLRVPWIARRSNQSILKEINLKYSLEGLTLQLKLQYFGHLMWRADSLEKTLMLGKIEGKRRSGWQRIRWLDSNTNSKDMNMSKFKEITEDRGAWCAAVNGVANSWTRLSDWTTLRLQALSMASCCLVTESGGTLHFARSRVHVSTQADLHLVPPCANISAWLWEVGGHGDRWMWKME